MSEFGIRNLQGHLVFVKAVLTTIPVCPQRQLTTSNLTLKEAVFSLPE